MRKDRSIGEMISTVVFFGVSVYLLGYSVGLLDEGEKWRGTIGLIAALFCALGGLRFVIANLVSIWRKDS